MREIESTEIMGLLKEINCYLDKGLKKYFASHELTVPQLAVVNILDKNERVKLSELSERLRITPAAVSGIIDRLEARGLVERVRSDKDKRIVHARLSESFKASHGNLDNNIHRYMALLLRNRDKAEITKIKEGLEILKNILLSGEETLSEHVGKYE